MRLQDIIVEKLNENVKFKYEEDVEGDNNRGWQVDQITAYVNGEEVGYIKLSYIASNRVKKWYPSIFNYVSQIIGKYLIPYRGNKQGGEHWSQVPADELRRSIYSAVSDLEGRHLSMDEEQRLKELSDDQILALYGRLEKMAQKKYGRQFKQFMNYFVDKPIVDFIRVSPEHRRQGIGTALYRAAQKWLRERGMKLYASGIQSDEAKAAWKNMRKQWPIKTERPTLYGSRRRRRYFAG